MIIRSPCYLTLPPANFHHRSGYTSPDHPFLPPRALCTCSSSSDASLCHLTASLYSTDPSCHMSLCLGHPHGLLGRSGLPIHPQLAYCSPFYRQLRLDFQGRPCKLTRGHGKWGRIATNQ